MPPIFGHQTIANFDVYSYPKAGSYALATVGVLLLAAVWMTWRQRRRNAA